MTCGTTSAGSVESQCTPTAASMNTVTRLQYAVQDLARTTRSSSQAVQLQVDMECCQIRLDTSTAVASMQGNAVRDSAA